MGRKLGTSDEEIKQSIYEILASGQPAYPANVRLHLMQRLGRAGSTDRIANIVKEVTTATQRKDAPALAGLSVPDSLVALTSDYVSKLFEQARIVARAELEGDRLEMAKAKVDQERATREQVEHAQKLQQAAEAKCDLLSVQLIEVKASSDAMINDHARMDAELVAAKGALEAERKARQQDAEKWEKRTLELEADLNQVNARLFSSIAGQNLEDLANAIAVQIAKNGKLS